MLKHCFLACLLNLLYCEYFFRSLALFYNVFLNNQQYLISQLSNNNVNFEQTVGTAGLQNLEASDGYGSVASTPFILLLAVYEGNGISSFLFFHLKRN